MITIICKYSVNGMPEMVDNKKGISYNPCVFSSSHYTKFDGGGGGICSRNYTTFLSKLK
jgi:hypothetical protein